MKLQLFFYLAALTTFTLACSDDTTTTEFEEKGQFDQLGNAESPESPNANGETGDETPSAYATVDKVDILYVADNTGSMCEEQAELRNRFDDFINPLIDDDIDFHIGITTTTMTDDYSPEPVAVPGELQSTPQPIPGFDPTCRNTVLPDGTIDESDYKPVQSLLALAAECANVPVETVSLTNEELDCYFNASVTCREYCDGETQCQDFYDLFEQFEFPEYPKVLKRSDYTMADGTVDRTRLYKDFRCASLVGTRGYGIEKGLQAASLTVSPEKTGYVAEDPRADALAPNHGFLRRDSRLAVIFLTDEEDCSHDGGLDEATSCGGDLCSFAAALPPEESPLIDVRILKDELLTNLSESKGRAVADDEVTIVSLHGTPEAFEPPQPLEQMPEACNRPDYVPPGRVCQNFLGTINSGSRYATFAALFPRHYPDAVDGQVPGALCDRDFGSIFDNMATAISVDSTSAGEPNPR